jgi:hypothetical protein
MKRKGKRNRLETKTMVATRDSNPDPTTLGSDTDRGQIRSINLGLDLSTDPI